MITVDFEQHNNFQYLTNSYALLHWNITAYHRIEFNGQNISKRNKFIFNYIHKNIDKFKDFNYLIVTLADLYINNILCTNTYIFNEQFLFIIQNIINKINITKYSYYFSTTAVEGKKHLMNLNNSKLNKKYYYECIDSYYNGIRVSNYIYSHLNELKNTELDKKYYRKLIETENFIPSNCNYIGYFNEYEYICKKYAKHIEVHNATFMPLFNIIKQAYNRQRFWQLLTVTYNHKHIYNNKDILQMICAFI